MDNILINFTTGDQSGLQDASNGMDKIIQKEGQIGEAWQKTSDQMNAQNKATVDNTNKLSQSVINLAAAAKSMDKIVIGGAYKQYLQQIQQQLGLTNAELIKYIQNAKQSAQTALLTAGSDVEAKQLTVSIQAMDDVLEQFGITADTTGVKVVTLRQQIKEVKDQLVEMANAGLEGTPAFKALQQKAGELNNQYVTLNRTITGLGSDTRNINGLISLASGVAGGYAVAQGAAALFGDQNNAVAQALLKVNAAMSILQGLQQVQEVLQKESAASLLLNNILRKQSTEAIVENTVATEADAGAKVIEATATEGAAVAQEGLNIAMASNPVGVVLVGMLALIAAISLLSDNSKAAAEQQRLLNDAIEESGKLADFDIDAQKKRNDLALANAKNEGKSQIDLAVLQGNLNNQVLASIKQRGDAATAAANKQLDIINTQQQAGISVDKTVYDSYNKLIANKEALDKQYNDLYQQQLLARADLENKINEQNVKSYAGALQAAVALTIAGSDQERQVQIAAIQLTQADRIKSAREAGASEGEIAQLIATDERQIQGLQLQNYQHYLKGRSDQYAAYIAQAKIQILQNQTDSIESINKITDLQIDAQKKQRAEALSNPTLNAGEQAKIVAEANLQIITLEKQKQAQILDIQKSAINSRLVLAQAGSLEEYNDNIQLIDNEQQVALQAAQLTQEQIDEINNTAIKKRRDAERAFNEFQLSQEISRDNAALARFGIDEQEKLALTLKRLADQEAIEISQAQGNAAKISEIQTKYDQDRINAQIASIDAITAKNIASYQAYSNQVIALDQKIASSNLGENTRISAVQDLQREQEKEIQFEINANQEKKDKNLITDEEYNVAYQVLLNKKRDLAESIEKQITEIEQQEVDKRVEKMTGLFDFFRKGFESFLPQSGFQVALSSLETFGTSAFKIFSNLKQQVSDFNKIIFDPSSSSADVLLATDQKAQAQKEATRQAEVAGIQAAQDTIDQIYADSAAERQEQLQADLAANEDQRSKEVDNANLTKQQTADINAKYDEKEKQIKLKAWKADQDAKKQQAIIDGLLGIARTFAEFGWPAGIIPAAIQAATTAIIVAKIASTKPPKFRHGEIDIQGPGTKTSDSIPALISKGESVIKADATEKWKEALTAINNDNFENYLGKQFKHFVFPTIPDDIKPAAQQKEIDYERLATTIAAKMKGIIPGEKSMHFNIDKNGIHTIVQEGNSRTEFKNKRYSMS